MSNTIELIIRSEVSMSLTCDRRETPRKVTAIRVETLDGGPALVAHDISLGGMMVTSPTPRWPGEMMRVRFRLPRQDRSIRATCRVVDLIEVPRGVGLTLQFLQLSPLAQLSLSEYVDSRPLEVEDSPEEAHAIAQVESWVRRILEDCNHLRALARS